MLNGDSCLMDGIWSHNSDVTTMHPTGGREVGWDKVRERWDQLARLTSDGQIRLKDQLIRVEGDIAYEVGTEEGQVKLGGKLVSMQHRVTNIYRREAGVWKAVHHHADISPVMAEVVRSLEPKPHAPPGA
ncbi:MAG: nuclear transport factor 2 family protein [Deltaproteobacteria bacterium]|nr:nuclear transport factor 2 family protein [Deltaproteobacteria bacterium]